ncbi:MAG: DEAD/DEAH box helicase family protein, partial [Clostridia bacterium]|nr:DEAD/DEAH box helicase family protein [Clostridia bacterium]
MIAKLAVSCCVYAIDKPYSYRVPASMHLQPGMRVCVPFGKGNRTTEAIVLGLEEGPEDKLKTVEQVLDEEPVLTLLQLQLAAFIHERYFCTYYDAVKAILPAGLWFKTTQVIALNPPAGDWREMSFKTELPKKILLALEEFGGSASANVLRAQFEDDQGFSEAVQLLKSRKAIISSEELFQKPGGKTEKIAALCVSTEDAEAFAAKKQKSAPLQAAVLRILCSIGSGSCHEILYLTGASMATVNRLAKLGMLEISEREVLRLAARPESQPAGPIVLNEEQQAAFDVLSTKMQQEKPGAALLYGVTGSGKTAVYIRLIRHALDAGKSAMLLVPEIALTPQLL